MPLKISFISILRINSYDTYECITTNLDRDEFPLEKIKKIYKMRWRIETTFKELKYAVGLNALAQDKITSIWNVPYGNWGVIY